MTHPLRKLLERRERSGAQNVNASFVEELGGGFLSARLSDTGVVVRAKRSTSLQFARGQEIILARPDGSGRSRNTGYIALGPASASVATSSPVSQRTEHAGASITSIDPNPAIVGAGETVNITVRGEGFTSVPEFEVTPTYGSSLLTDVSPPTITDDEITMTVAVGAALGSGDYRFSIGSLRTEDAYFQVSAASFPAHSIWALTYRTDDYVPRLLRIDAATMELFHEYEFDPSDYNITDMVVIAGILYAKGGITFLKVNNLGGAGDQMASVTGVYDTFENSVLGVAGQYIFYGDLFDQVLNALDTATDTESTWFLSTSNNASAVIPDGATAWVSLPADHAMVVWDIATALETNRISVTDPALIVPDATHLYVSSASSILKIDKGTLVTVDSVAVASSIDASNRLVFSGGLLYATCGSFAAGAVYEIDPATMTVLRSLSISDGPLGFTITAGRIYVGDAECGVSVIDLADFSLINRYDYSASDPASTYPKEILRVLYT